ncbi:MAG: cytochrome c [Gammaproteobacteria bacterium]|nr:cytochrome c [Gammaproteobacteria bacterium]
MSIFTRMAMGLSLLVALAGFWFPMVGSAAEAEDAELLKSAWQDYHRYCAACHGRDGKGDGALAYYDEKLSPPDLTQLSKNNGGKFPFARIHKVIDGRASIGAHGTSEMPIWGERFRLTGGGSNTAASAYILRISHYLRSIQEE